jgi:hypothetical protein
MHIATLLLRLGEDGGDRGVGVGVVCPLAGVARLHLPLSLIYPTVARSFVDVSKRLRLTVTAMQR